MALVVPEDLVARTLRISAGPIDSSYHDFAREIVLRLPEFCPDCQLQVLADTQGSYDNVRLLREGQADLALTQSDVAYLEHFEDRSYQALVPLFLEPIHILQRRELSFTSLKDLEFSDRRLRVCVGPRGSGTASQALMVLDSLQLEPNRLQILQMGLEASLEALAHGDMDIVFVSAAVPASQIQDHPQIESFSLLGIEQDIARSLLAVGPFLSQAEIPYKAYGITPRSIPTIGTRALLIGRPDLEDSVVASLMATIDDITTSPPPRLPDLESLSSGDITEQSAIPLHPAAQSYLETHESRWVRLKKLGLRLIIPIAVLLLPLLLLLRPAKVAYALHQYLIGRLLVLLAGVWLTGSAAMYLLEGTKNSSFSTMGRSSIAIIHYLTSGLETNYPVTTWGNVVAIIMLTMGVAIVTTFTGTVATVLLRGLLNVRHLPKKPWNKLKLKDHLVIIGWSPRVHRLIQTLHHPDIRRHKRPVVVITEDASETRLQTHDQFHNTWVVEGQVSDALTLNRADLSRASHLVIMDDPTSDSVFRTIAASLAAERTAPQVHSVVEVADRSLPEHAACIKVDEVIDTSNLCERFLGQCLITPGLHQVYQELLTFKEGSQEIYLLNLPKWLDGLCWVEICQQVETRRLLCIGFRTAEGRLVLNPLKGDAGRLILRTARGSHPGASLVILADSPRELSRWTHPWLQRLKPSRIKEGKSMSLSPARLSTPGSHSGEKHICICGWGHRAQAVLEQLEDSVIVDHRSFRVRVITDRPPKQAPEPGSRDETIRFVVGDPTRRRVLESAGIKTCDHLVIIADRKSEKSAAAVDHRTLVIALAALDVNPDLHVIAELLESRNMEHFGYLPNTEAISVLEISEKMIAQTVVSPGISQVYSELLTANRETNEIYLVPIPQQWTGRTFQEIRLGLAAIEEPVCLLGFTTPSCSDGPSHVVLNPSRTTTERDGVEVGVEHSLQAEDLLIVMAYEEPEWGRDTPTFESASALAATRTDAAIPAESAHPEPT